MGRARAEKVAFWRFVLAEHAQNGLSVREFCRAEGVSEPSFYAWRRTIQELDSQSAGVGRMLPVRIIAASETMSVQPAVIRGADAEMTPSTGAIFGHDNRVEIAMQGGLTVRVGDGCSVVLIQRVLDAIQRLPGRELSRC